MHTSAMAPAVIKHTIAGPGGWRCPCCMPQSGKRGAAAFKTTKRRQAKKRERRALDREMAALVKADLGVYNTYATRSLLDDFDDSSASTAQLEQAQAMYDEAQRQWAYGFDDSTDPYPDSVYDAHSWANTDWKYTAAADYGTVHAVQRSHLGTTCSYWSVYKSYDEIGHVILNEDLTWEVCHYSMGYAMDTQTFDYLEMSLDAAVQILGVLARLEAAA